MKLQRGSMEQLWLSMTRPIAWQRSAELLYRYLGSCSNEDRSLLKGGYACWGKSVSCT